MNTDSTPRGADSWELRKRAVNGWAAMSMNERMKHAACQPTGSVPLFASDLNTTLAPAPSKPAEMTYGYPV